MTREAIHAGMKKVITRVLDVQESDVTPETRFVDDLGADSLERVDLLLVAEEEFGVNITDEQMRRCTTVEDANDMIEELLIDQDWSTEAESENDHPRVEVVSAVIIRNGRVLLTQRDPGRSDFGMAWESPGGKVEAADSGPRAALAREIREELSVDAEIGEELMSFNFDPPAVQRPIRVTLYRVDIGSQTPRPLEAIGIGWFGKDVVHWIDLLPANHAFRADLVELLES